MLLPSLHKAVTVDKVEFIGMDAPDTDEEKSKMYSEASVKVTYNNGAQNIFFHLNTNHCLNLVK